MKTNKIKFFAAAVFALMAMFGASSVSAHDSIDLEYIDAMMMHHRDGIAMARMAETKGHTAELKKFAANSITEQKKGIAELEALRQKLYNGEEPADGITVNGKRMSVGEMKKMAAADMKKLEAASGAEFDQVFLDTLTKHHRLAIDMSNEQINRGESAELKKFSHQTIDEQNKSIGEMAAMRKKVGTNEMKPHKH